MKHHNSLIQNYKIEKRLIQQFCFVFQAEYFQPVDSAGSIFLITGYNSTAFETFR